MYMQKLLQEKIKIERRFDTTRCIRTQN